MNRILRRWQLYIFLLVPLAWLVIFCYIPMVGVTMAFKDFRIKDGIWGSPWVGLKHFQLFFESPMFWTIIKNTLGISLYSILAGFPIPIILALALNEIKDGIFKRTVQMVTYAPYFLSTVVIIGILFQLLDIRTGLIGSAVNAIMGRNINIMAEAQLFSSIFVWSGIWQGAGYSAIIYLAALSGIDPELYDAAKMDGASRMQKVIHIDLPGIAPTIVIILIMTMGGVMNVGFEKVFLMQNPMNLGASEVISTYIYKVGLVNGSFGYSAAVGLFNSVINFSLVLAVNFISRKISDISLF